MFVYFSTVCFRITMLWLFAANKDAYTVGRYFVPKGGP